MDFINRVLHLHANSAEPKNVNSPLRNRLDRFKVEIVF